MSSMVSAGSILPVETVRPVEIEVPACLSLDGLKSAHRGAPRIEVPGPSGC